MRGFTWGVYTDDNGNFWALQVDSMYWPLPERGWPDLDPTGLFPLPRGWRPRMVVGVEPSGRQHRAVAPNLEADIWTGNVSTFTIFGNDGLPQECAIVQTLEELRTRPQLD